MQTSPPNILQKFLARPHLFFCVVSLLLSSIYIARISPLDNIYPHAHQRVFHVVNLAQSLLGRSGQMPESFFELSLRVPFVARKDVMLNECENFTDRQLYLYCENRERPPSKIGKIWGLPLLPKHYIPFKSHPDAAHFPAIGYITYIPGAWLGLLFGLGPAYVMYMAIIGSNLLTTAMGYYTLRILPVFAWPMCFLLLLPSLIMMRAFVMPDAFLVHLSVLLFAIVMRHRAAPHVLGWREHAINIGLGVLVAVIKAAYIPLAGMLALIPTSCFGALWKKFAWLTVYALSAASSSALWASYALKTYYPEKLEGKDADQMNDKISVILNYPLDFIGMLFSVDPSLVNALTWRYCWIDINWLTWNFRWIDSAWIGFLCALPLFFWFPDRRFAGRIKLAESAWAAMVVLAGFLMLFTAMYLHYAHAILLYSNGHYHLSYDGVQTRYLMPYVPMIIFAFAWPLQRWLKAWYDVRSLMLLSIVYVVIDMFYLHYGQLMRVLNNSNLHCYLD